MKITFIKHEIFILAVMGAFQHNKIYADNVSEENKKIFRKYLEELLCETVETYKHRMSEDKHLCVLDKIKSLIELAHNKILLNGIISHGTVQKIFNLYLKYLWCIDLIEEPPHCPIDSIILSRLNDVTTKWTRMTKDEYMVAIEKIRQRKGDKSIAEWELVEFSRR